MSQSILFQESSTVFKFNYASTSEALFFIFSSILKYSCSSNEIAFLKLGEDGI